MELNFKPRGWQKEALPLWLENMRGVVSVVTGGGKTFFAFLAIQEYLKRFPSGTIIVIVPTRALLDQWTVGFIKDLDLSPCLINTYPGAKKEKSNKVNIVVINTARGLRKKTFPSESLLIVDECHRAGSKENAKCFNLNHNASLGLSATPKRQFDQGFDELIAPNLGEIIYEYNYNAAYKDGVISNFKLINIRGEFNEQEESEYNKINKSIAILAEKIKKGLAEKKSLKNLLIKRSRVSNNAQSRLPIAIKLALLNRHKKVLIFTESIDQANNIYRYLNENFCSVTIYHSKVPLGFKQQNLMCYRDNDFNILVTCKSLDEGMNVPETDVAIIVSSTSSDRQRTQRLGRVLRVSNGKDIALIYTIFVTNEERRNLNREANKLSNIIDVKWLQINHA